MNGIFWGADDNYVQATGYKQEQKIRFIENIVNVLANQGKLDDILIDEWPYISEKYLQILQPYLEREVLTNGDGVIGLLQNLLEGAISYSESFFEKTKCLYQKATNTSHTSAEVQTSPLVLDLDGDGVETVSVDELPKVVYDDVIVLGNRSNFSTEDVKQRLFGEPDVIEVSFDRGEKTKERQTPLFLIRRLVRAFNIIANSSINLCKDL